MIRPPPPVVNMQLNSLSSISPSFTSHSSNNLADIAARVVEEFRNEKDDDDNIYNFNEDDVNHVYVPLDLEPEPESNSDSEQEFEFAVIHTHNNSSTTSPDHSIFFNGEIIPRYPLFDRSLLLNDVVHKSDSKPVRAVRRPLRNLFNEERETTSSSSSESDDLDGVSPETYCVWKPKPNSVKDSVNNSVKNSKKSNSTGSGSKRWKFRNLVHRSNSDISETTGKNAPVIIFRRLTATKKISEKIKKVENTAKEAGADEGEPVALTDEIKYKSEKVKEGNRIRSYLPYKPDLVGVFGNVNGLSRNLHPF